MYFKNREDFIFAFDLYNRSDNFSEAGRAAFWDSLEEEGRDENGSLSADIIAICCYYQEFKNLHEYNCDYDNNDSLDDLKRKTDVIEIPNSDGFIIRDF